MRKQTRFWSLMLLSFVVFLTSSPGYAQGPGYTPEFVDDACPFPIPPGETEGETLACGYLLVPQDRSDPAGLQMALAVAVLFSPAADTEVQQPIVYLEGGPGGSALSSVDAWPQDYALRLRHHIILIDQRGAGYSYPRLHCSEFDAIDPDLADNGAVAQAEEAATSACQARFAEQGIDIRDFNSINNAADIADLRVALGIDWWTLYGVSYGTRLGLSVMREYPEGVYSVVLDSTYPPVVDAYNEQAVQAYRSFALLFDRCAADAACDSAYPDLENVFYDLVDSLNVGPAVIPETGIELTGDDLVDLIFQHFYSTQVIPYLPRMIYEISQGTYDTYLGIEDGTIPPMAVESAAPNTGDDLVIEFSDEIFYVLEDLDDDANFGFYDGLDTLVFENTLDLETLTALIDTYMVVEDADYLVGILEAMSADEFKRAVAVLYAEDVSDTQGMFDSFECNEEIPFNSYDVAVALAAEVPEQIGAAMLSGVEAQFTTCATWSSGIASAVEDQAVVSSIPTLVLAGEFDPITPPDWGMVAVSTLQNGYFYEFPGVGHGAIDGGDCPVSITLAFLENPAVAPDGRCIDGMTVTFVTP